MISVLHDDYSNLNELFDDIYKEKKSKNLYVSHNNHYSKELTTNNKENIQKLIQNTTKIIRDNNFNIKPSKYYIEFHKYFVNGKTKPLFDYHCDDYGIVSYKTVTCIYYLTKNNTIEGGDLEFKNQTIINVESNMMIIFNGDLEHRVTNMNGIGERKCIVIQFKRIK